MRTAYFIPTNRSIAKCADSYIKEIEFAYRHFNTNIPFVILDINTNEVASQNHQTVLRLKKEYPHLQIYYLGYKEQLKYFNLLFEGLYDSSWGLKNLFFSRDKDYGRAMNKIFLLTCSLGVDGFHRRDSDTRLLFDEINGARKELPIEIELKYLGKPAKSFDKSIITDENIWVVGGNYYGEWNLDLKDFARESYDYLYELFQLIGFPQTIVKDLCKKAYQFERPLNTEDKLSLATSFDNVNYPDGGNLAVYNLHEFVPAICGTNIISADYFPLDVTASMGIPFLHHNREVFHEYNSERFNFKSKLSYWEGMLKFADYFNLYSTAFDRQNYKNTGATPRSRYSQNMCKLKSQIHKITKIY